MLPVKPVALKYTYDMFSPTYDCVAFLVFLVMVGSSSGFHCEVIELPAFVPNEYLLKTHADKAKNGQDWEVFAWAVRDVISKGGNMPLCNDQTQADRLEYKAIIGVKTSRK